MHKAKCHCISSGIHALAKDEYEAMEEYEKFLKEHSEGIDKEDICTIQEIISDEKNHSLKLQAMVKKYDGGIPAAPDGAKAAIKAIKEGIE